MPQDFPRRIPNLVKENGATAEIHHHFNNASVLKVQGGQMVRHQIRIMFGNANVQNGWWVEEKAIADLVAQLLYLRQDLIDHKRKAHGVEIDQIDPPLVFEEEEEEDDNPDWEEEQGR